MKYIKFVHTLINLKKLFTKTDGEKKADRTAWANILAAAKYSWNLTKKSRAWWVSTQSGRHVSLKEIPESPGGARVKQLKVFIRSLLPPREVWFKQRKVRAGIPLDNNNDN